MNKNKGEITLSVIIKQLRVMVDDFLGSDGETIREKPKGQFGNKKLNDRQITFYRIFTDFLMNSKYLNCTAQIYLRFNKLGYKNIAELYNVNEEQINVDVINDSIEFDEQRIIRDFGENVIVDVLRNKNIEVYEARLHQKMINYSKIGELEISLILPKTPINTYISSKDFLNCISQLLPYSKKGMQEVVSKLSNEQIGYLEYLVSSKTLNDQDKERKALLYENFGRVQKEHSKTKDDNIDVNRNLLEAEIKMVAFKKLNINTL